MQLNKAYDYLFALLLVVLPLSKAAPNIVIAVIAISFIVGIKGVDFRRLKSLPFILLYGFLCYFFIKAAITGSLFAEWNIYKKYIILFFIPVLFLKVRNVQVVKAGVVVGTMLLVAGTFVLVGRYYISHGVLPFGIGEVVNTLILLERPYAGFFAVAGTIFSLDLIKYYPRHKKLLIACSIVSVAFILLIAARISFLSLIVLTLLYILFYLPVTRKIRLVLIIAFISLTAAIFFFNKNIADRFFLKESMQVAMDYEPRLIIWPCAYELSQRDDFNPVTGYPDNTIVEDRYVDCYTETITDNQDKNEYYRAERFNSHNQFIDFYLTTGLIGILLFGGFIIALFLQVKGDFAYTAIIIAMLLFMLVENVLHRQMGSYFFSIFGALLLMRKIPVNEN
ncbi:O-antigen ligase family protein [Flavobacterium hauense]